MTGQPAPLSFNPGPLYILAAAMLWGTTGTAQALAPAGATPAAVGVTRLLIGGAALLALAAARGALRGGGGWPWRATLAGAAAVALYQLTFFGGVARTGVAAGTVVAIGSGPVMAGLLGLLFLGERPTPRWAAATLLAVAGCVLLVLSGGAVQVEPLGIALALGAGLSYAAYTIASKALLAHHPPDAVTGVVFSGGALLLAPLLFVLDFGWLAEPRGLLVALHLGFFTMALSYALFIRGLGRVPAASAVTLALMEPATAALLGVTLLGERLPPAGWLGIGLLLAGLLVLTLGVPRPRARRSPRGGLA